MPFFSFLGGHAALLFLYYTKYLGVDDEEFGRFDLLSEGFMPSFAGFLVCFLQYHWSMKD